MHAAIQNAQFEFPQGRLVVNRPPADLAKDGGRVDLPIALSILAASGQIPPKQLTRCDCLGELALSGELHAVNDVLPAAMAATADARTLLRLRANGAEAALVSGVNGRIAQSTTVDHPFLRLANIVSGVPQQPSIHATSIATGPTGIAAERTSFRARPNRSHIEQDFPRIAFAQLRAAQFNAPPQLDPWPAVQP